MKKAFTVLMAVAILAAVTAPTFAQGRSRRAYSDQILNGFGFGRLFLTTVG